MHRFLKEAYEKVKNNKELEEGLRIDIAKQLENSGRYEEAIELY